MIINFTKPLPARCNNRVMLVAYVNRFTGL